jgi:hypothetical protein
VPAFNHRLPFFVTGFLLGACHHPSQLTLYPAPCVSTHACANPVTGLDSTLTAGSLRGLVLAQEWVQTPLGAVQVYAQSRPERLVYSSKDGTFRLAKLQPGQDTLIVRMIGYIPRRIPILVPPSGGMWVVIPLHRSDVEVR